ncbi:hypothetical protein [Niveispirillum fermenti]|uniref:hypothetical protein n=1 Tax=Niveispirillum fermenti TaxID=1233113 RepID=UPI003A8679BE
MLDLYEPRLFVPTYRAVTVGRWRVKMADLLLCKGYWSEARLCRNMAGLLRRNEGGLEQTWMSTTPMEIESQELGCLHAHGHVVIMGMGMGWCTAATAMNPAVTTVTTVELDPAVLELIAELGVLDQLPPDARAKIRTVNANAHDYVPDRPVDLLMPDIWQPLMNDGRVEEVQAMTANCKAPLVYFWGQELEIARHARLWGYPLDRDGVRATVARFGLPLLLPDDVDYPDLIARAANQWMGNDWFPPA